MPSSNMLHASTGRDLLTQLREMLDSSARTGSVSGKMGLSKGR